MAAKTWLLVEVGRYEFQRKDAKKKRRKEEETVKGSACASLLSERFSSGPFLSAPLRLCAFALKILAINPATRPKPAPLLLPDLSGPCILIRVYPCPSVVKKLLNSL